MSGDNTQMRRVIGVEEHAWTTELRNALLRWGDDETVNKMSSRGMPICVYSMSVRSA